MYNKEVCLVALLDWKYNLKCILDKFYEKTKGYYPFFKYCPPIYYINKRASETLGYTYNYLEPQTLNEKIRWLIYNEKLKMKSILTDKIKVKTYITENLGEGHCAPIYGIWDKFDDIDFSYLPNKFVLKANHAWNTNIFIKNKKQLEENKLIYRDATRKWLKFHYEIYSLEPQYKFIKPKLFIEKRISENRFCRCDYRVHCFNGEPSLIEVSHTDHSSSFYNTEWKMMPYSYKGYQKKEKIPQPGILDEMIEYSRILAQEFSYVRIDFAQTQSNAKILEMTFTPYSGMMPFSDKLFDKELGDCIKLPIAS